ncbi:Hypothetical predicted protein [Paramuricea clavata]|uniref:Uncharacterized protein n=1 Tax=Paramuricea clavata TaxID=317549 RepID=A0A6S7HNP8_PARCT|nr:Hypothetical predicted protein [Paramuricea clavata]
MGELRPLSPYPVNFQMPYQIPGMDTQPSDVRQPVVVDLLTSPEDIADNGDVNKIENPSKITAKVGDFNDIQVSGKLEALAPQSLCDESIQLVEPSCCVNQSTAGASGQSVVCTSGNQHERSSNITRVSESIGKQLVNRKPSEGVKDISINHAVSVSSGIYNNCNNPLPSFTALSKDTLGVANFVIESGNTSQSSTGEHFPNKTETTVINLQTLPITGKNDTSSSLAGRNSESLEHITMELPSTEMSGETSL